MPTKRELKKNNFMCWRGGYFHCCDLLANIFFSKQNKCQNTAPIFSSKKPIIPLTEPPDNQNSSNKNIPDQREDINSQLTLEQRKRGQKLSPVEEKTIIESLASRVGINKDKSFFDYKWGFGMVPGVGEEFYDHDEALYLRIKENFSSK